MTFPKWTNRLPLLVGLPATVLAIVGAFVFYYYLTLAHLDVGYQPVQPVAFSHRLHAGELRTDCRYCHSEVERAAHANVPTTETCMNCHMLISSGAKTGTAEIAKVRAAAESGTPIAWKRVHRLADYVHFDHGRHVRGGVSCVECHGRIDQMDVVRQTKSLSMGFCLDCHRDPDPRLRDPALVTKMDWVPGPDARAEGKRLREAHGLAPRQDCNTCHR